MMNTLFCALLLYSRIPTPKGVDCRDEKLSKAIGLLPFVGLVVGAIGWLAYWAAQLVLPNDVAIIAAMVAMILATGALHEDGLADMCDGFGGGYDREARLRIMKDSHIGTYGTLGLILMLLLRYTLITNIESAEVGVVILLAQGASRFAPVVMVRCSNYARSEPSKSSYSALGVQLHWLAIAAVTALVPLALLGWYFALCYCAAATLLFILFRRYIHNQIGGFTGDTLGALQQLGELLFYALYLAI